MCFFLLCFALIFQLSFLNEEIIFHFSITIALISGGGVFYNQFTNKEKTIETPSTDITENIPVNDEVTIYVSGEVNSPGVITLDSNCRIKDAIIACGDFTPLADKNSVNLAQKVTDGMQIKVSALSQNQNDKTDDNAILNEGTNNKSTQNTTMVNINTASKEELDTLPGVGPATADKIIEYRETNGQFNSIEDIKNVRGIGEAKFSKMQSRIQI